MNLESAILKFERHLLASNRSQNTIKSYIQDLNQLKNFLSIRLDGDCRKIHPEYLDSFFVYLSKQNLKGVTRLRKFRAICAFFEYLQNYENFPLNPAAKLKAPKSEIKEPRVLSETEYRVLRDSAKEDPLHYAIIELMLQTGMRISEVLNLNQSDIAYSTQFGPGQIHIENSKGNKSRNITMNSVAEKAIRRYIREARPKLVQTDMLFVRKNGKPVTARSVRYNISKYYKKSGIKNATIHTLRHTFCTHQARRGTSLLTIQKMAGHAQLTTTQIYLHLAKEMMDREIEENAL